MKFRRWLAAGLAVAAAVAVITTTGATAQHEPADKVSASGATAVVVSPASAVTILSERVRTAAPTDLILGVTLECVVTTELTTIGNDTEQARARVRVWVTVDGTPVPVSADDANGTGRVTFCDRLERRDTTNFDDNDATIHTLNQVGTANGFNWLRLNTGPGVHLIEVKATLQTEQTSGSSALAAVGKRTLIIEPVKAANDEQVTDLAA